MKIKNISYPIRSFKVASKSRERGFHIVELWSDGTLACGATSEYDIYGEFEVCMAGFYRKPCRHKEKIKNYLKKYEPEYYESLIKARKKSKS